MPEDALLDRIILIDAERASVKARGEELLEERLKIEAILLDQFGESGTESIKKPTGTIFLRRQLWAKAKDGDKVRALAALKKAKMKEFISEGFNTNQISAYAREAEKNGEELPKAFLVGFDVNEKFEIRTRRK